MSLGHSAYNLRDMSFELCVLAHGYLGYKEKLTTSNLRVVEVYNVFESNFLNEIQLKMISAAILFRRLEDESKKVLKEGIAGVDIPEKQISYSSFGFNYGNNKPIKNLREASNKIIHSEEFWLCSSQELIDRNLRETGYFDNEQYDSLIYFTGKKFKDSWLVAIDLLSFSENLYGAADIFAEYYGI